MIEVLEKAFRVIEAMAGREGPGPLGDLARKARLPKSTSHRILRTLDRLGVVAQDPRSGLYSLTPRLADLGRRDRWRELLGRARPVLEELHRRFNETVNLGVLDGLEVRYLHCVETTRPIRWIGPLDAPDPYWVASLGRAIAAFLPPGELDTLLAATRLRAFTPRTIRDKVALRRVLDETRAQGWAFDDEQQVEGVVCLGAPILKDGYPEAGVSFSMPKVRMTPKRRREMTDALKDASATLST